MNPRKPFRTFTLNFSENSVGGVLVPADFPELVLLQTLPRFQVPYYLVGFDFSATFTQTEGNPTGVFLVIGQDQQRVSVSPTLPIIGSILCPPLGNLRNNTPATSPVFFDEDFGYPIPVGCAVSLYGCNATVLTVGQFLTAVCNIYVVSP